jgi:ribosomal protein S18 acetylase RimI-like enzyme
MKQLDPTSDAARDLASGRFVIRTMDVTDMRRVPIPWMRDAGWNPGLHDAETFLTADADGFLIGELDGQAIACVSAVRYDDHFGFMGCYIVDAAFRGRGYGMAVHEAGRRHLAGCVQGGDGVLENVAKYERIGRVLAYRNARREGIRPQGLIRDARVVPLESVPWSGVFGLDCECFPAARERFLRAWTRQPDAVSLAVPDPAAANRVLGYGVIRPCFRGWKIGPLFARNAEVAEILFTSLLASIPAGAPFWLDVAEPNAAATGLADRFGMKEVFATARMYTGPAPQLRLDLVFGITTFELG